MKLTLTNIDYVIFYGYFIIILFVGFYFGKSKQHSTKLDLILGGRKLTLPLFVVSLVATWYGNIIGVGEFVSGYGLFAFTCFSIPYYLFAIIYANIFSTKIRENNFSSLPELLDFRFGKYVGLISNIFIFIISLPAAYICIMGIIINMVTGLGLLTSMILSTILSTIYLYNSGLKADVVVNSIQFVLMYVGFALLFYYCYVNYGNLTFLSNNLIYSDKQFITINNWQIFLVWLIIALQTFIDPSFYQRCAASGTSSIAKKGIYISVVFWFIFDFFTISTALYGKTFLKGTNSVNLYLNLAQVNLPSIVKGIFIISIIATAMSTLTSYTIIAGNTITNIVGYFNKYKSIKYNVLFNISITITIIISIIFAYLLNSPLYLLYYPASVTIPGLILLTFVAFSKRFSLTSKNALILLIFSNLSSFIYLLFTKFIVINILPSFEPMIIGIVISLILGLFLIEKQSTKYS